MVEESANFQGQSPPGDEKKGTDAQGEDLTFGESSDPSVTATRGKMENMSLKAGLQICVRR